MDQLKLEPSSQHEELASLLKAARAYLTSNTDAAAPSMLVQEEDQDAQQACLVFVARTLAAAGKPGNQGLPLSRIVATASTKWVREG